MMEEEEMKSSVCPCEIPLSLSLHESAAHIQWLDFDFMRTGRVFASSHYTLALVHLFVFWVRRSGTFPVNIVALEM